MNKERIMQTAKPTVEQKHDFEETATSKPSKRKREAKAKGKREVKAKVAKKKEEETACEKPQKCDWGLGGPKYKTKQTVIPFSQTNKAK